MQRLSFGLAGLAVVVAIAFALKAHVSTADSAGRTTTTEAITDGSAGKRPASQATPPETMPSAAPHEAHQE